MKDQYAGDISDYLKISLLRCLSGDDRRLAVAWYYNQGDDGRSDGKHVDYTRERRWRLLDAPVHDCLAQLVAGDDRCIRRLQGLEIWPPGTLFHEAPLKSLPRPAWLKSMCDHVRDAHILFLDPDNGIGRDPAKHATEEDLEMLRSSDRALVFIHFPGRKSHDAQVSGLHKRLGALGFREPITLRTRVRVPWTKESRSGFVPLFRFFTLLDADTALRARLGQFAERLASLSDSLGAMAVIDAS